MIIYLLIAGGISLVSWWFYRVGKKEGWKAACEFMEKDLMDNIPEDLKKELENS